MFGKSKSKMLRMLAFLAIFSFCSAEDKAQEATAVQYVKEVRVGIDLGTTFSCVYMYDDESKSYFHLPIDSPEVKIMPSTIYFTGLLDSNKFPIYHVGYRANLANEADPRPDRYFYKWKPMVGQDQLDPKTQIAQFPKHVTYELKRSLDKSGKGYFFVEVRSDSNETFQFTPTDLSSIILGKLKSMIDDLHYKILSVCITTPVYYSSVQDNEIKLAGIAAGFPEPYISKEPVAACVSYVDGSLSKLGVEEKIMVFDFGGGTLDLSILEVIKEKSEEDKNKFDSCITVNSFVGDNFLGGENINDCLVDYFSKLIYAENNIKTLSQIDMLRLRLFIENFKIQLCNKQNRFDEDLSKGVSKTREIAFHSDVFTYNGSNEIKFEMDTRKFNSVCKVVFDRVEKLFYDRVEGIFKSETIAKETGDRSVERVSDSIKKVILVGGSTRIPEVKSIISKACKNAEIWYRDEETDLAVGRGACMVCVNSDPTSGESSIMILGAVPLPIGVEIFDGSFAEVMKKDITIPTTASMPFTTLYDGQTEIAVNIYMGVRPLAKDNEYLGKLKLTLKNPQPKGIPQINVTIQYNSDYSFSVTALDVATGTSEMITFDSKLGKPSQSKIEAMLESARQNKAADEEMQNKLEKIRMFDSKMGMLESMVKQATTLNEIDKSYFEAIIDGNRKWLSDNRETITSDILDSKLEELTKAGEELAAKIKETSKPTEAPPAEPSVPEPEKVPARDVL